VSLTTQADGGGTVYDLHVPVPADAHGAAANLLTGTLPVGWESWHAYVPNFYYGVEVRIPLTSIGNPVPGSVFRISYGAYDVDADATEDEIVRWTANGADWSETAFDSGWGQLVFTNEMIYFGRPVPAIDEVFYEQGTAAAKTTTLLNCISRTVGW